MKDVDKWRLADEEVQKNLPLGVKLVYTLRGHNKKIGRIMWSPDGRMLASPSNDKTIRLWDTETGKCLRTIETNFHEIGRRAWQNELLCVAFDPESRFLAFPSVGHNISLLEIETGKICRNFPWKGPKIWSIAISPDGDKLAIAGNGGSSVIYNLHSGELIHHLERDEFSTYIAFDPFRDLVACVGEIITCFINRDYDDPEGHDYYVSSNYINLWDTTTGKLVHSIKGHEENVLHLAFNPLGQTIASTSLDNTIKLWEPNSERLIHTLEGHTSATICVSFMKDGKLLASKCADDFRIWNTDSGDCVAIITDPIPNPKCTTPSLAFHPRLPLIANVGSDPGKFKSDQEYVIHIYELDPHILYHQVAEPTAHYINAKIILVGDTSVGKTGLSLVLNNQPFQDLGSTHGRHVWTLNSKQVTLDNNIKQTRETLLWDLAGQPGYRVIHQLHLNEIAVALVVFDARSEIDPLAGVRYWERALRLVEQHHGTSVPMKKFLVSARNDRGGVSISDYQLQAILKEFGFVDYFKTSAKEGWQINELRDAIEKAIDWEKLPKVSSSQLFADIKWFLLDVKKTGWLVAPSGQLYEDFVRLHPDAEVKVKNLRNQFNICVGQLENRDLIRRLTFGSYILLQPELLDAYASAMVNAAKDEPYGLGSLAEEVALTGKFFVPKEQKITDLGQEQLLLHATVEELVRYDLALRENTYDGRYLVFPSQFNREYEDAPEPKGKAISITFEGPIQSLYATLVVRLSHSGLFVTGRADMWRNTTIFIARAGGKCGLYLQEFAEARGRLILFFDLQASPETRFHFEEFILAHIKRHSLDGTMEISRFFACSNGHSVPDDYLKILLAKGNKEFTCPCGSTVCLVEPQERIHFRSELAAMDKSANQQRDFDAFVLSAKGETSTKSFKRWSGDEEVTLAIVFTDIVGSTALGEEIRDEAMNKVRRAHFANSRRLIDIYKGKEIKTIGDSFMVAFKSVNIALDYAIDLQKDTGDPHIQIRAGIHIGPMHVKEEDIFGGTVDFAARVVGAIKGAEIWLSDRAKEDIDRLGAEKHKHLRWERHDGVEMKGFSGMFTLWSVK